MNLRAWLARRRTDRRREDVALTIIKRLDVVLAEMRKTHVDTLKRAAELLSRLEDRERRLREQWEGQTWPH